MVTARSIMCNDRCGGGDERGNGSGGRSGVAVDDLPVLLLNALSLSSHTIIAGPSEFASL